jgi:hypothetical protein
MDLQALHLRLGPEQPNQSRKQMYLELQQGRYTVDHLAKLVHHNNYGLYPWLVLLEK